MKKGYVFLLLLLMVFAIGISAQDKKMAVGLDTFPLIKGIIFSDTDDNSLMFALAPSFEYLVAPHFSVGGVMDLWFGKAHKVTNFYFDLVAHGRYYPVATGLDGFFLDVGLGFNIFAHDGKTKASDGGAVGLLMSLKAGYKLILGPGFFIEPSMSYVHAKTPRSSTSSSAFPTPFDWEPGLVLGWAF